MERYDVYRDIAKRTQGDIYIGVVGPVRTGKSTFIKQVMELLVLPNIENTYKKERAKMNFHKVEQAKPLLLQNRNLCQMKLLNLF